MKDINDQKFSHNYYEVLGLQPDASQDDVERAYHKLKKLYSDQQAAAYSLSSQSKVEKINSLLEEAYLILSSYEKRVHYQKEKGLDQFTFEVYDKFYSLEKEDLKKSLFQKTSQEIELDYKVDQKFENEIDCLKDFNGETLKKIRLYKNASLEAIARSTNIMKNYIMAIEEDNFSKLPANVYLRGFIYQYAKALKLNPDLVMKSYMQKVRNIRKKYH